MTPAGCAGGTSPAPAQPDPAVAAAMLRDLTEAVAAVAGRMLGLPPEDT